MKTDLLNCRIDLCDLNSAFEKVKCAINSNTPFHIVTINPEMIMHSQENEGFLNILNSSDLNIIDGIGVKIALKFKGININHIRGVDFSRELIHLASLEKLKIAFIGAKEEVINKACESFLQQYPSLNIVYKRNGYFDDDDKIIEEIKKASPQIILAGLGSPRQEEFIFKLKNEINAVMIGVGGSFDVLSGVVQEAPLIYQKLGLEWLYRTISQPERFKRIFPTLPIFLIRCIIDTIIKKG